MPSLTDQPTFDRPSAILTGHIEITSKMLAEQEQLIYNLLELCSDLGVALTDERIPKQAQEPSAAAKPHIREQLDNMRRMQGRQLDDLRVCVHALRAQLLGS